jgi:hypothetical protein
MAQYENSDSRRDSYWSQALRPSDTIIRIAGHPGAIAPTRLVQPDLGQSIMKLHSLNIAEQFCDEILSIARLEAAPQPQTRYLDVHE